MKKKILLLTDFSRNAWKAINYALELYKNQTCDFYILNVYTINEHIQDSLVNSKFDQTKLETLKVEKELEKLLELISFRNDNNSKHNFITLSLLSNNFLKSVKGVIEEKDIEMIVMGTKGKTNSNTFLFGSNATIIMEKVRNCPVIVIPEIADTELPKEIVFPTSYKTHFKRRELMHLIEIAKNSNAIIKVLHISEENILDDNQNNHIKLLEEYFKGINYSFHTLTNTTIQNGIHCFVESRGSNMVAFINKKHTFFSSLFTTPLVKGIGYFYEVPILVMHDLRN